MLGKQSTQNKASEILGKLYPYFSAIYLIDIKGKKYTTIQADDYFQRTVPSTGSLGDIYSHLFASDKEGRTKDSLSSYRAFSDEKVFSKENFNANIELSGNFYHLNIFALSEEERVLLLMENTNQVYSDKIEQKKIDTLQEHYLFSMIVDLGDDTCRNSATTEISVDRQDYLDIKYSQWRYMISNMFLPNDQNLFLTISEPNYIINRLEKEKKFKFEIQMQNMEGKYIWVRLMFSRMQGFSRTNPVFVYTVQDIHKDMTRLLQQKNIIDAIEEKNEQLTNINRAKTVFISNMSHEIRTPINAVLGMDEMILRETNDENIRSYANDIKSAGTMLLSIINDILDYSKIEIGKMEIIPVEYSTKTLLRDIYNLISVKIKEKGLTFHMKTDASLPALLFGDEVRIKQIIINLLTNAVKYTEAGSVSFSVESVKTKGDTRDLLVQVQDTGIGMKPEEMKNLFTEFQRLDEKRNRNIEGTGLGMSIVIQLLKQMGSELQVESEYGKGSKFSFVLTQKVVDNTAIGNIDMEKRESISIKQESKEFTAPDAHILVVDDTRTNLTVVKGLLKRTQIQIDCVQSGMECLEMIKEKDYQLIFLDHLMPEMDGIETLGRIREMHGRYDSLPVIALTANVVSGARERYINAGFTDFLEKPIIASKLDEALLTYLPEELISFS